MLQRPVSPMLAIQSLHVYVEVAAGWRRWVQGMGLERHRVFLTSRYQCNGIGRGRGSGRGFERPTRREQDVKSELGRGFLPIILENPFLQNCTAEFSAEFLGDYFR